MEIFQVNEKYRFESLSRFNAMQYFHEFDRLITNHTNRKTDLISPDELELPWEPLYAVAKRVFYLSDSKVGLRRFFHPLRPALKSMVLQAKIYFPVSLKVDQN